MNKQLLALIIFISAAGFVVWQYLLPAFNGVLALREELVIRQEKFNETRDLKIRLADLEKKYKNMASEVDKVGQAIPAEQDIPGLLVRLEELSSQNGLILQDVNFSAPEIKKTSAGSEGAGAAPSQTAGGVSVKMGPSANGAKILMIDLSLNGTQSALKNFLKATENNLRIMDVTAINFAGQEASAGALANQDLQVSLNTYFRE